MSVVVANDDEERSVETAVADDGWRTATPETQAAAGKGVGVVPLTVKYPQITIG
jgi:hypothetical protein